MTLSSRIAYKFYISSLIFGCFSDNSNNLITKLLNVLTFWCFIFLLWVGSGLHCLVSISFPYPSSETYFDYVQSDAFCQKLISCDEALD